MVYTTYELNRLLEPFVSIRKAKALCSGYHTRGSALFLDETKPPNSDEEEKI